MEDELIGYVERECEKLRPAKAASGLSARLGKRREILIAGDTARCHGFEDACCQDCSRKLQREQPNDCDIVPRIDVVQRTKGDEASNEGEGLRLTDLDEAIDAAMKQEAQP